MLEEIYFLWWAHRDQRGNSSSHLALQHGRLCTCESSKWGRAITSHYWVLQSRDGLSHLFFRPFTPVMSGRSLIMALHHQLKSCTGVQEMENGKILVFTNAQMLSFNIPCICCGVTVRLLLLLPHFLGTRRQSKSFSSWVWLSLLLNNCLMGVFFLENTWSVFTVSQY